MRIVRSDKNGDYGKNLKSTIEFYFFKNFYDVQAIYRRDFYWKKDLVTLFFLSFCLFFSFFEYIFKEKHYIALNLLLFPVQYLSHCKEWEKSP